MTSELPDQIKRWTAKRRSALVLQILKGETTVREAARQHGLKPSEIEDWKERFIARPSPARLGVSLVHQRFGSGDAQVNRRGWPGSQARSKDPRAAQKSLLPSLRPRLHISSLGFRTIHRQWSPPQHRMM